MIETIVSAFDVCWFWLGRVIGGVFTVVFAFAIFMTILEFVWLRTETVWKSIGRAAQETKLFTEFLKWKREKDNLIDVTNLDSTAEDSK